MMATRKKLSDFERLERAMPGALVGSHDPMQVKTVEDLAFIARHELDLDEEGELDEPLPATDRREIKAFLRKCLAKLPDDNCLKKSWQPK